MKLNYIYLILLFMLSGCELIPDLERDNPNDKSSENFTGEDLPIDLSIQEIDYVFSYVTNGGSGFSPSSKTYVKIVLKNNGESDLEAVTATVSTTSNLVDLSKENFPIRFENIFGEFPANEEIQGKLYDEQGEIIPCPNDLSYSFYIEISSTATIGEQVNFTINLKEKYNRTWSDSFTITIQ
ncbi:MAG: hypothetical protein GXO79_10195 [Chlorobi bacterium]|nr:hypothetical protein [Chlorobiota bacterium]